MRDPERKAEYDRAYYASNSEKISSRAVERQRDRQRRAHELKRGIPCSDCGEIYPSYVMQWDHRPGEQKLFSLYRASHWSWAKILAEVAKCDLVCANCHFLRSGIRAGWYDANLEK